MVWDILVDDVSKKLEVAPPGFEIHPGVTETLDWVMVPFLSSCFSRGGTLKINFGGTLLFQGEILKERHLHTKYEAYAYNRLIKLRDEFAVDSSYYEYTSQTPGYIVKDLLDHYFAGDFDTTNIDTSFGT